MVGGIFTRQKIERYLCHLYVIHHPLCAMSSETSLTKVWKEKLVVIGSFKNGAMKSNHGGDLTFKKVERVKVQKNDTKTKQKTL